jgi:NTP pyrophosphatase (non-canonical NTP hydrolase)
LDFEQYQTLAAKTDETKRTTVALYGLAGEIGGLFSVFKKRLRDRQPAPKFREALVEELGDVLWYLSAVATQNEISLQEVAEKNVIKTKQIFDSNPAPLFDDAFPENEKFPHQLSITFQINQSNNRAEMFLNGKQIGAALSDNVFERDGYKFHDALHLAFLAHLHWSPVMRALLNIKRKSAPEVDENEDGARARINEEAAAAIIFAYAENNQFFESMNSIPHSLVKILQQMTSKFEVSKCSAANWRHAIFDGSYIFSQLCKNNGGTVKVDLLESTISFE